jgi:hypothetical protein
MAVELAELVVPDTDAHPAVSSRRRSAAFDRSHSLVSFSVCLAEPNKPVFTESDMRLRSRPAGKGAPQLQSRAVSAYAARVATLSGKSPLIIARARLATAST